MTDPSSFSTALWTVLIVSAVIVAFGLAALSDMAMRRREDRAARADGHRRDSVHQTHQAYRAHQQDSVTSVNGHNGSTPTT
ncbi:histidine kinase [Nocardiopsis sp. TSRI0078]|uniref:histidine kinase n=1 Tax=unclassified Nocardiopsis TaxID=2649073 RepID=UPI00093E2AD3|nr:histidine kinase [Nocardiopsis sp. TSRI0078]OKI17466.1 histidine kinase [Nocardiopsis sp. TSRI0078]